MLRSGKRPLKKIRRNREEVDEVKQEYRFRAIEEFRKNRENPISVSLLCKILKVSRSGYYKWKVASKSTRQKDNELISKIICSEFHKSGDKAGYRKLTMILKREYGIYCNHKRVRRLMCSMNLRSIIRRKRISCTVVKGNEFEENILNRDFYAEKPNEKWVTDVTFLKYGKNKEYKAYFSAIKDLCGGQIISWVVSKTNDNSLVMKTLH